jgi:Spy/CpxP family protein refolding chaperone
MFRRFLIISSMVVALAGTAAFAQGVRAKGLRRGNRQEFSDRTLERLQQKLNLNETQLNGIRALQETRQKEAQPLQQETQQKRQALKQLLHQSNPNPTDVGNATLALKQERERMRDINQRFLSGVKGLLTPDQIQQLPKRLR